jgi:hypothetical protein
MVDILEQPAKFGSFNLLEWLIANQPLCLIPITLDTVSLALE